MDNLKTFVASGTISPPGIIGRSLRFLLGVFQFYFVAYIISDFGNLISSAVLEDLGYLTGVFFALWILPLAINIGFNRSWGKKPLWVVIGLAVVVGIFNVVQSGMLWSPLLGAIIAIVTIYAHGHVGLGNILAAFLSTPGCEVRAIPHFISKITGSSVQEHYCPGLWTPIDNWESGKRR